VTGANGFLGSEIVRQLAGAGMAVRATDRHDRPFATAIEYVQADILDARGLRPVVGGADTVIHAAGLAHVFDRAAERAPVFEAVNAGGTANVARAAAETGVRHLVLISSVSVYGGSRAGGHEDSGCRPKSAYARSKYEAEMNAAATARASGMALTVLRLATLYGEGDPGNVGRLMRAIDRRRFVRVGACKNRKSLLHREDAARACVMVAGRPGYGIRVYNVAAAPVTMDDVVKAIAAALGRRLWPVRVPSSVALAGARILARVTGPPGAALGETLMAWLADDVYEASRFATAYGFESSVPLGEGLRRQAVRYRDQGGPGRSH
jgi:nucleoside-diphosphate-sugar epimerase